jgi:small subunit ribosomal protein S7
MARRRSAVKREILPDPRYRNVLIARFINCLMKKGKKSTAERIFYSAMNLIEKRIQGTPPLVVVEKAVDRVKPFLEVKSRRVGGATYQVPMEVRSDRQTALAVRWIVGFARSRKGKPMYERIAAEIMDAYKGEGASVKKREDTHKMAEANKAFAHYRW